MSCGGEIGSAPRPTRIWNWPAGACGTICSIRRPAKCSTPARAIRGIRRLPSLDMQIRQMLEIEAGRRERSSCQHRQPAACEPQRCASESAGCSCLTSVGRSAGAVRPQHSADADQQLRDRRLPSDRIRRNRCSSIAGPWRATAIPRSIRRNLDAVLAQINADDPPSSPLIICARQPRTARGRRARRSRWRRIRRRCCWIG